MSASSKCMYAFLSFSHYQLWQFRNVIRLNEMHLIISRAADNAGNMSALKIKNHNINSVFAPHNLKQFNHLTSLSKLSSKMLCMLVVCIAFKATAIYLLNNLTSHKLQACKTNMYLFFAITRILILIKTNQHQHDWWWTFSGHFAGKSGV